MKSSFLVLFASAFIFSCAKDENTDSSFKGEVEMVKTYGGSGLDEAVSITESNDGGFLVLGTTKSSDGDITDRVGSDSDFWLLKITKDGEIVWSKTYGGSQDERASAITKTNDGGYLLTGYTASDDGDVSNNEGFQDYWIVKVDANGTLQWDKNFGFAGSDQAFKSIQTSDGGYFITGFFDVSASGGAGNDKARGAMHGVGEYWGIRLDASGNKLWRRYFGGSNNDRSYDAVQTDDGGFLMTGTSESVDFDKTDPKGTYDFWAVRITAAGDLVWTKSFGGSEIDNSYAATKTNDGNYIMVGDSRSIDQDITSPKGSADAWVVKFNDAGEKIWQRSYGGSQFETAQSIARMANGQYVISGHSRSVDGDLESNNGVNDAWVFGIDDNGNLKFQVNVGGSGLDYLFQAIETSENKIIAVGNSESNDIDISQNQGDFDFLIIKIK